MALISVEVCDVCRNLGRPIERWTLGVGGQQTEVLLCEEDAMPLRAAQEAAGGTSTARRTMGRPRPPKPAERPHTARLGRRRATMAEIEKLKMS